MELPPTRTGEHVAPPVGKVALVFTDVQGSTRLWEKAERGMRQGLELHDRLFRALLEKHGGFEVKTEGDAFMIAFSATERAVRFCVEVQESLMQLAWPAELLAQPDANDAPPLWRGLRVRMGIHVGTPDCRPHPKTKRMDYFGPTVNRSARVASSAHGGQLVLSAAALADVPAELLATLSVKPLGTLSLKGLSEPETLTQVLPRPLAGRVFPSLQEAARRLRRRRAVRLGATFAAVCLAAALAALWARPAKLSPIVRVTSRPPARTLGSFDVAPDGRSLLLVERGKPYDVDPSTGELRPVAWPSELPLSQARFLPDGSGLLASSTANADGGAALLPLDRAFLPRGEPLPHEALSLAVAADGTFAAVGKDEVLRVYAPDGGLLFTPDFGSRGERAYDPAWSPDGSALAAVVVFRQDKLQTAAVYVVRRTGEATSVYANPGLFQPGRAATVAWSGDDALLVGLTEPLGRAPAANLFRLELDETFRPRGPPERLTDGRDLYVQSLRVAGRAAFFLGMEIQEDVEWMALGEEGQRPERRRVVLSEHSELPIGWDGEELVFSSSRAGGWHAFAQGVDELDARRFLPSAGPLLHPALVEGGAILHLSLDGDLSAGPAPLSLRLSSPDGGFLPGPRISTVAVARAGYPTPLAKAALACGGRTLSSCWVTEDSAEEHCSRRVSAGPTLGAPLCRKKIIGSADSVGVSPDGRMLAYPQKDAVELFDVETGESRFLPLPGCWPHLISFDPRRAEAVFVAAACPGLEGRFRLLRLSPSGAEVLASSDADYFVMPRPSPDGRRLAYGVKKLDDDVYRVELP